MISEPTDIGHGVVIAPAYAFDNPTVVVGLTEDHDRPDGGGRCAGFVLFDIPEAASSRAGAPVWTVESSDPLTLSPSLLCRSCGNHGWIRNGQWVPA